MKKVKKPKYKVGDMVYSWRNPTEKKRINRILISEDPNYDHKYRLTLTGDDGYNYNSSWINETSIRKTKK